jgi:hypothetical protein
MTDGWPADGIFHATKELYAAVGAVASAWAFLEGQIDLAAIRLAGLSNSNLGLCFTAQVIGSARKLDAYIAVAKERGSAKFSSRLEAFVRSTSALAERRNRIVHDMWIVRSPDMIGRYEITARRKLRSVVVSVTAADVLRCFSDICDQLEAFRDLDAQIRAEVGTLPGTSLP